MHLFQGLNANNLLPDVLPGYPVLVFTFRERKTLKLYPFFDSCRQKISPTAEQESCMQNSKNKLGRALKG